MKRAVKFSSNATVSGNRERFEWSTQVCVFVLQYKKWVIGDKAATPVTSGLCGAYVSSPVAL